jgi:hypothetical protein
MNYFAPVIVNVSRPVDFSYTTNRVVLKTALFVVGDYLSAYLGSRCVYETGTQEKV